MTQLLPTKRWWVVGFSGAIAGAVIGFVETAFPTIAAVDAWMNVKASIPETIMMAVLWFSKPRNVNA